MAKFSSRKKTTRTRRVVGKNADLQKLHLNVSSPRIMMFQCLKTLTQVTKVAVTLLLLGLICYGGYRGIQHLFLGNEKYVLQEIELNTNGKLSHARVVETADIDLGASIFAIDINELQTKLKKLPDVISCDVERRLPGKIRITLKERVPTAWVLTGNPNINGREDGGTLIDNEGITFTCEDLLWETAQDLPVIVIGVDPSKPSPFKHGSKINSPDTLRALHLIQQFSMFDVRSEWLPERVIVENSYSIKAVCNDGSHATFGMYDHERQISDFITIREHTLKTNRQVQNINLIPKINIPVTFANNSSGYTHQPLTTQPYYPQQDSPEHRQIESILGRY